MSTPELLERVRAQFPELVTRDEWGKKISRYALAGKNAKRLLKKNFPGVDFSVKGDAYSGGSSLYIYWDKTEGAPTYQQVDKVLHAFSYGKFDGMDDSFTYDSDPERDAFRELFGSVKSLCPQPRLISAPELAEKQAKELNTDTPQAPARTKRFGL